MVYCCMVWGCQNRPDREDCRNRGVSFHRLPVSDLNLLRSWIAKIGVTNYPLSRNLRICSEHFELDCFVVHKDGRRVLKRTAVPSLFNYPADNVQAMFPAFPLNNLSTEDLRALKAEPTTPNSMIAKMGASTPANLSLKDGGDIGQLQRQQQIVQTTRWSLLPDGKNMIDSPYSIGDEMKQINHDDLLRSGADNYEGSPAAAETPGASSTISGNGNAPSGSGTNNQNEEMMLPSASPFVVVGNNNTSALNNDDELIDVGGDHHGGDPVVGGNPDEEEGRNGSEPDQKRFRASSDQNVAIGGMFPNSQSHHLLAKIHPNQFVHHHQIRRPRQPRKPALPKHTAARVSPQPSSNNSNLQPNQSAQQAAAASLINLLNGANFFSAIQQQQQNPSSSQPGALDLSVRNMPLSLPPQQQLNSVPRFGSSGDIGRVRSLIAGYRESASFLTKAADELESFMTHVQSLATAAQTGSNSAPVPNNGTPSSTLTTNGGTSTPISSMTMSTPAMILPTLQQAATGELA